MNTIERSIPQHTTGLKKEFTSARRFITTADARLCYATAVSRLININHWHELSPAKKGGFQVMSKMAKPQRRRAKLGDYIRIGTPAPENTDGAGYDWVHVVTLKFLTGKRKEQCLMTLRPCPMPGEEHTAHFFSSSSTSSFLITRDGKTVTAAYYGHNETPNTDTEGVIETARNIAVAAGAILGFSNVLWVPLTENLIADGTRLHDQTA
jgi:hypothetical protein